MAAACAPSMPTEPASARASRIEREIEKGSLGDKDDDDEEPDRPAVAGDDDAGERMLGKCLLRRVLAGFSCSSLGFELRLARRQAQR